MESPNEVLQKMIGELVFQIANLESRLSAYQEKFGPLEQEQKKPE